MRKSCLNALAIILAIVVIIMFMAPQAMAVGTHAGSVIGNQAYVDYKDANDNPMNRVYSNLVQTLVSHVAGVENDPSVTSQPGIQGTTGTYPVTITNHGNDTDTFDLLGVNACGWTVTIYKDLNSNSVLDPNEMIPQNVITDTGQVQADANFSAIVMVEIPAQTPDGTQCDTTFTTTSQFDPNISDQTTITTDVRDAVLSVTKTFEPTTDIKPGDIITYAISASNTGSATAEDVVMTDSIPQNTTYETASIRFGLIGGTYQGANPLTDDPNDDIAEYNDPTKTIIVNWGDLPPGASGIVYFQVKVNDAVPKGTQIQNTVDVDYNVAGNPQPPITTTPSNFDVANLPGVQLSADGQNTGNPGDVIVYPLIVTNSGNDADTIDLTYSSDPNLNWSYVFWKDMDGNGIPNTDGDYTLGDTDGDLIVDTDSIPQDGNVPLLLVVTIPPGTPDKTFDTVTVTSVSSIDPNVSETANFKTTVTAPILTIDKEVNPTGAQPPGTELTYTITVTNTGTGRATAILITDTIPTYTTYKPGSIETGDSLATLLSRSDAADGDGARFESNAVLVGAGGGISLNPTDEWIVRFVVKID